MTKMTILWSFLMMFAPSLAQNGGDLRLRDGASSAEGRLEIYHSYEWGTICDDYFDMADADVACRQLGYTRAQEVKDRAYFGYADSHQQIWLDNVNCQGTESSLIYCSFYGWGHDNCNHNEDVGIICTYSSVQEGALRLVDGEDLNEGRVEINHNGVWGTICNDYWGLDETRVACRQLGYNGVTYSWTTMYGPGQDPIHLDDVHCGGYEANLLQCSHRSWGSHNCQHFEDVGIKCYGNDDDLAGWAIFLIVFGSVMFCVILAVVIGKVCSKPRSKRNATATAVVATNNTTPMQNYPVMVGSSYPPPNTTYPPSTAPYPPNAVAFQAYPPTVSGLGATPADGSLPPSYSTVVPSNPTPMPQPDDAGAACPPTVNVPVPEVKG